MMDGAREYNARQNKSIRERQIPYDLTHMWNLRNRTNEQRKRERERETKKQTLNYREQTWLPEGRWVGGWVKWVMGIKERTCVEYRVMYGSVESLNSAPEANKTLYINCTGIKISKRKTFNKGSLKKLLYAIYRISVAF